MWPKTNIYRNLKLVFKNIRINFVIYIHFNQIAQPYCVCTQIDINHHNIHVYNILFPFHLPAERSSNQIPRAADLLRVGDHRPDGAQVHRLGLSGGGRGPPPQEQPVQGAVATVCQC